MNSIDDLKKAHCTKMKPLFDDTFHFKALKEMQKPHKKIQTRQKKALILRARVFLRGLKYDG